MGKIVDIQMVRLAKLLEDRKITIVLEPAAREWLAEKGWDPAYGARPLKRVIQKSVQDPLAEMILAGARQGRREGRHLRRQAGPHLQRQARRGGTALARLVVPPKGYIGKYIPGQPQVIVGTCRAAAVCVMTNYVANVSNTPRTACISARPQRGWFRYEPLLGDALELKFDPVKLSSGSAAPMPTPASPW